MHINITYNPGCLLKMQPLFCCSLVEDAEEEFPVSPLDENLLDDNLTPLERLEKFYATEEIFER